MWTLNGDWVEWLVVVVFEKEISGQTRHSKMSERSVSFNVFPHKML